MFNKSLAALAAASLAVAPVMAQAQSVPSAAAAPSIEQVEGSEAFGRGGIVLPVIAAVAVVLAILALTNTWPFDDKKPVSP
ncbi:MAG: hypothetical protein ACK4K7_10505 [Allosphingosinicella sp.]|uniref:hypothetical protein n=1 Tax=Allosphingosinicella sp. TaxID=2823234 RepID=UPI003945A430